MSRFLSEPAESANEPEYRSCVESITDNTNLMKTIVITGTSRGIGLATAHEFLARGYRVIGTSTSGVSPIDHQMFIPVMLRLEDPASVGTCIDTIRETAPTIAGLINNAAVLLEDWDVPEIEMTQLQKTFEINVFGLIQLTEGLLEIIESRGGIINLSSGWGAITGKSVGIAAPHYKLSKATINLYTRMLNERLAAKRVSVSAIDPGWVRSDMGTRSAPKSPAAAAHDIAELFDSDVPGGRFWSGGRERPW